MGQLVGDVAVLADEGMAIVVDDGPRNKDAHSLYFDFVETPPSPVGGGGGGVAGFVLTGFQPCSPSAWPTVVRAGR